MKQSPIIPQKKIVQVPTDTKIDEFGISTPHNIEQEQKEDRQQKHK